LLGEFEVDNSFDTFVLYMHHVLRDTTIRVTDLRHACVTHGEHQSSNLYVSQFFIYRARINRVKRNNFLPALNKRVK